ncbi:MAG: hypothetical protein EZS28_009343 [Streblomastix strix]|uniref:Uncharacterized protein n=1 Tax=Streblomastix strix TaxID=222440 RepID=A0A5J4WJK4_9EUKA|nr:MAG: hypothetical protein EZS28_009343 [Streblomastix strix]
MEYWWDGTGLRALETELPDMSFAMTILGTATRGGNGITGLSQRGNTLIPAKNCLFVTNNYDQIITGQKKFNLTMHSVGIMVQNYNNNSIICAGGGDKAIQDKNVNKIKAYTNSEDDDLLLLKATKTQLIDAYTKSETNNLLNSKADSGDAYSKGEDDTLLLLKADKTQLIDAYTKIETNNLLNINADSGVSYIKGEDDTLLLLKPDKTQLIDACTKGETDNLLNNKADSGVSYLKGEVDALLLQKVDKTQLIDAYTKRVADNLLNYKAYSGISYSKEENDALLLLKANQSTTYTKTETDYLISKIDIGDVYLSGNMTLAGDTFVLLGACGTKPLSGFVGSVDDSNYVKKTGQELQFIHGVLRGEKDETFKTNVNVTGFVKTG